MDKKEGGESQLDVGGIFGHRLSPIHYTSITEIKGFRLLGSSAKESNTASELPEPFFQVLARDPADCCAILQRATF
ncbi:MAG: hypothetical protein PHN61_00385 [Methanothrix sp.]|nr:hypothetical protein [Methanothrix sp.]